MPSVRRLPGSPRTGDLAANQDADRTLTGVNETTAAPMADQQAAFPRSGTRLRKVLSGAASGAFPPADGAVEILPQPSARDAGVIAFTGHAVVFADADPEWIASLLPADDLSAPLSPRFLVSLGERLKRAVHNIDMLACAGALADDGADRGDRRMSGVAGLTELTGLRVGHPRVARALRYRDGVRVWEADGGVIILGQGVAGRWEVAIEVDASQRNSGLGARLAAAARRLAPPGEPLWAQIAPGNAASVRAFLRAGFRPVGAEALLSGHPPD